VSYWLTFTPLAGHTAMLPGATTIVNTASVDERMTLFPFFQPSTYHWAIAPYEAHGYRFECDDYANGPAYETLHQVWAR
jgi:hypothetical protein